MKQAKQKLGHPIFILSLVLLLLNDWYLKAAHPSILTGKLSDFAGLFALPFLLGALFPKGSKFLHVLTALLFIAWKSPLVQPAIELANTWGIPLFRTVDFTDCIALLSIPLSFFLLGRPRQFALRPAFAKGLVALSAVAFVATSMPPQKTLIYAPLGKTYDFSCSKQELIQRINRRQEEMVKKMDWEALEIRFDADNRAYYSGYSQDTIVKLLDPAKVEDEDLVEVTFPHSEIKVTGDESQSKITLVRIYWTTDKVDEKDNEDKAIKNFERQLIRKMKR